MCSVFSAHENYLKFPCMFNMDVFPIKDSYLSAVCIFIIYDLKSSILLHIEEKFFNDTNEFYFD